MRDGNFFMQHQSLPETDIISISGGLDLCAYPKFEKQVQSILDSKRFNLVIDCKDLTYISSNGLGGFIDITQKCKKHGGIVEFVNVNPQILNVMSLLGFKRVLTIK